MNLPRAPFHEDDSYGYKQSPNKINRTRDKLLSADRLAFYQQKLPSAEKVSERSKRFYATKSPSDAVSYLTTSSVTTIGQHRSSLASRRYQQLKPNNQLLEDNIKRCLDNSYTKLPENKAARFNEYLESSTNVSKRD